MTEPTLQQGQDSPHDPADLAQLWERLALATTAESMLQVLHDVRNLLTPVLLNLEYMDNHLDHMSAPNVSRQQRIKSMAELRRVLLDTQLAARSAADLTHTARDLAHPGGRAGTCVVDAVMSAVGQLLGQPVRVRSGQCGVAVRASHGQLLRVLVNLTTNAVEATADQRKPRVVLSSWCTEDVAFVEVADNGPGIDTDDLDQVFELYHTTKSTGTGVGLFVCRQLARQWGGDVDVFVEAGTTRFVVTIPRSGSANHV